MSITDAELEAIVDPSGQAVLFDGLRVRQVRNKLTGVKDWDSLHRGERVTLKPGDHVRVSLDAVVRDVQHPEKFDAAGRSAGPLRRVQILQAIDGSAEVLSITTREEADREWTERVSRG